MTTRDRIAFAMLVGAVACGATYAQVPSSSPPPKPPATTTRPAVAPPLSVPKVIPQTGNVTCPPEVKFNAVNLPAGWDSSSSAAALMYGYTSPGHPDAIYCYYNPGVLIWKTVPPNSCVLAGNKTSFACN
jgi:hypothetical protein